MIRADFLKAAAEDSMAPNPAKTGYVRIRGEGSNGGEYPMAGEDVCVEALQADGTWLPIRGVCAINVRVEAQSLVTAELVMEPHWVNLSEFHIAHAARPTWYRRMRWWWNRRRLARRIR